uniref:Uncharacterized protein n=1 Tax=Solanum tuberosum TaxID=4113 RepID=M1DTM7_SOLTU
MSPKAFGDSPKVFSFALLSTPLNLCALELLASFSLFADRKTITLDPNIPSWAKGFCRAVHVFLADLHSTDLGESGTVVSPEVQLERVNPSPSATYSARESEWAKAEAVLKAAARCSRQTKSIRGIWIEEQSKDTNRQKGTKQADEMKMAKPKDPQEHSACHQVAHQTT